MWDWGQSLLKKSLARPYIEGKTLKKLSISYPQQQQLSSSRGSFAALCEMQNFSLRDEGLSQLGLNFTVDLICSAAFAVKF
jgi:hypothetical protein